MLWTETQRGNTHCGWHLLCGAYNTISANEKNYADFDDAQVPVDADIQAPELMQALFDLGSQLLLCMLPLVWEGRGPALATEQQEEAVVFAPKVGEGAAGLT